MTHASESVTRAAHSPSWIDRLVLWVEQLPGPAWLFYVLAVVATTVLINLVLWIDGSVQVGSYGAIQGVYPPFVIYVLALYHYLTRVGSRSLLAFRPLMAGDEVEYAQIDYELATLPRRLGWLTVAVALASTPLYFFISPVFGDLVPETPLPYILAFALVAFFQATLLCLIIRSLRQLRTVHTLHTNAVNINLLKLRPAHALSGLTAGTGIGLILLFLLGYLYSPGLFPSNWLIAGYLIFALPAVAAFVVPLVAMRDRIRADKWHLLDEVSDLIQLATEDLERKVRARDYEGVQGVESAIRALVSRREMVEKIPTWPWEPTTLRGFASTLLLPIVIWIVTRLLERML